MMNLQLPEPVQWVMKQLQEHGYPCFLVGGCVRDYLLDRAIHDYDMATAATPTQMLECFDATQCKIIQTGIRHGTLTVIYHQMPMEITTFRKELAYEQHRRPKQVVFCDSLISDLARRDFTINAMAYHPEYGLIDPFNGQQDIKQRIIRCVGSSSQRFEEDALRILRSLRFSFQLRFEIAADCRNAIVQQAKWISCISKERIRYEFDLMLMSDVPSLLSHLREYGVLTYILPELSLLYDLSQESKWHIYDAFQHTDIALDHTKGLSLTEKLAVVCHDLGKAVTKTMDEQGQAHFYGHPKHSADLAKQALQTLTYPKKIIQEIVTLIYYHDATLQPKASTMRKLLAHADMDYDLAAKLLRVMEADDLAKNPATANAKLQNVQACQVLLEIMKNSEPVLRRSDLAINGHDLIKLGYQGKQVGNILNNLYQMVLEQPQRNTRDTLFALVKQRHLDEKHNANTSSRS